MNSGALSKKNSDEDRMKRKTLKSENRRSGRRRRRDSSPSSYSSSSEDEPRARRKRSHRKPKKARRSISPHPQKRRKDSKVPTKKKGRSLRHPSRDSSLSSASRSRSCSTCRGRSSSTRSERSRSRSPRRPDRKTKIRARGRSKGREKGRRRRHRSCSRSSCSGCSSRSKSRSSGERKHKTKDRSRRSKDENGDKIIRAYDDFGPSRGIEDYENDSKKDDFGPSRGIEDYENDRKKDGRSEASVSHQQASSSKKGSVVEAPTVVKDETLKKKEDVISSKGNTQSLENSNSGVDDSLRTKSGSMKDPSEMKDSEVIAKTGSSEAESLELILRRKALENFIKFRGGPKDESAVIESFQATHQVDESIPLPEIAKVSLKSVVCKPDTLVENEKCAEGGDYPIVVRAKSTINRSPRSQNDNLSSIVVDDPKINSSNEGQGVRNQQKGVNKTSNIVSSDKSPIAEPIRSNIQVADANIADGSKGEASGVQFEQRTFTRVHDGETVEVSYKVHIPKPRPSLVRRQLKR